MTNLQQKYRSKITDEQIILIFSMKKRGCTNSAVAAKVNVCPSTIQRVYKKLFLRERIKALGL